MASHAWSQFEGSWTQGRNHCEQGQEIRRTSHDEGHAGRVAYSGGRTVQCSVNLSGHKSFGIWRQWKRQKAGYSTSMRMDQYPRKGQNLFNHLRTSQFHHVYERILGYVRKCGEMDHLSLILQFRNRPFDFFLKSLPLPNFFPLLNFTPFPIRDRPLSIEMFI